MTARPGKTLPSVIVGGLLIGTLALGMGTAQAGESDPITAAECSAAGGLPAFIGPIKSCVKGTEVLGVLPSVVDSVTESAPVNVPSDTPSGNQPAGGTGTSGQAAGTLPANNSAQRDAEQQRREDAAARQRAINDAAARDAMARQAAAQQQAAAAQAAAARAAAQPAIPAGGLLTPSSFGAGAPGGLLTGVPAGAAGVGAYNPGLLLAPTGSPLRTLTGQEGGSPVTTASQVQSMAFDGLSGGLGTPAVLGVLILSTLGAFALRHRIIRSARSVDTAARPETDATEAETVETAGA